MNKTKNQRIYMKLAKAIASKDPNAVDMIREAVANGFPVDHAEGVTGWPMLHLAVCYNSPECCQALIELGADVNYKDRMNKTAMFNACFRLNRMSGKEGFDCVKVLIDAGADPDAPDKNGISPLDVLEQQRGGEEIRAQVEEYITQVKSVKPGIFKKSTDWLTNRSLKMTKKDFKMIHGKLAHNIMMKGESHCDQINQLIREAVAAGFPIDHLDRDGNTLLNWAAEFDKPECCRVFVELGADVNARNRWGRAPIHQACSHACFENVKLLTDAGADVNVEDNRGKTPFYDACDSSLSGIPCAKLVIDAGGDPNIPDEIGELPLDILEERHGKGIRDELEAYIAEHLNIAQKASAQEELNDAPEI